MTAFKLATGMRGDVVGSSRCLRRNVAMCATAESTCRQ